MPRRCLCPRISEQGNIAILFCGLGIRSCWHTQMRSVLAIRLLPILLVFSCLHDKLIAQTTTTGALVGIVTDPSGAVMPDAIVQLQNSTKGATYSAKTDRGGSYWFYFLLPGRYALTVSHAGFRSQKCEVEVPLGPPATRNVSLEIEGQSSSIKVTGEMPLFLTENGDASTTMNLRQVSQVPNPGNDLTYIAQVAPGAVMNTDTIGGTGALGNASILGMPGTSNLFTLNGMNNNNTLLNTNNSGALGMMLGQNEVQEATVISNGYLAQFGEAAGSNINYITKSGGNVFHGNAAYYWNGRILNANDWLDNAQGNPRPFDIANQWAGSLGGPIVKEKLFFFFDTEGMHLVLPQPTYVVLPTKAFEAATMKNIDSIFGAASASHTFYEQVFDLYNGTPGATTATPGNFNPQDKTGCNGWTNPNDPNDPNGLGLGQPCAVHFLENLYHPASESIGSGRVDWNIGAKDRAFVLVQYDHGQRAIYLDPISSSFNVYTSQPWWQGQLSATHAIDSTAANQFLIAGAFLSQLSSVANPARTEAIFPMQLSWGAAGNAFYQLGGENNLYAMPAGFNTTSFQVSDDLFKTLDTHTLGFGISFQRNYYSGYGYNFSGTGLLSPQTINAFFYGGSDPSNPSTDFTNLYQNLPLNTWNRVEFYGLGWYVQEEWHAARSLTLTLALRADHESNPICKNRCFSRLASPFASINHDPNQPYNQAILSDQRKAFPNMDSVLWSPRVSFAWQPFGITHYTVLRGGVGIFYDPVPGVTGVTFSANPPLLNSYVLSGYNLAPGQANSLSENIAASNMAFLNGFASGQTLAALRAVDPNFTPPAIQALPNTVHLPQYQKWSLQLQQIFRSSTSLTVGYFGNHGIHEFFQDLNANAHDFGPYPTMPCGSPPVEPCYDARFGPVYLYETSAISNYNGMVVSFEKRLTRWGTGILQVNYTYGHALDEVSNGGLGQFAFGSSLFPQDGSNLRGSYGQADYDVRHSLNANYVWQVPIGDALRNHGHDWLTKGWQLSGTVFARTGFPYTALDVAEGGNLLKDNILNPIYSVPVAPLGNGGPCGKGAAIPASPVPCLPPQILSDGSPNPGALFVQSGCETGFNAGNLGPSGVCDGPLVHFAQGRNHFRGPGYVSTDLAIMKNTNIPRWEGGIFSIGLQFFNLFNHANFGFPDGSSSDASFGQIFYQEQAPTSLLGSGLNANVCGANDSGQGANSVLTAQSQNLATRLKNQKPSIIHMLALRFQS